MPRNLKLMLSALVVLVGAVVFYFEHQAATGNVKWVVAFLALFMVAAMWVFPEASGNKDKKN